MIPAVFLASGVLFAAITALVARANGRPATEGLALGFFLGLLGLVIEAWLACRASARERQQAAAARQAKAARPLRLGADPLRRGEAGRMLSDLKRDNDA